jgi:hypothetical protein
MSITNPNETWDEWEARITANRAARVISLPPGEERDRIEAIHRSCKIVNQAAKNYFNRK